MLIARQPEGPVWKSVMGAQFLFAPIDRKALRRARRAALKALGRDEHEAETEASAASPNGTGAAATEASDIVSSPAKPEQPGGAKAARTVSKRPRTKTPKSSGKS